MDADKPSRAPIGGFNWGVGGNTKHPAEAFAAAACMRNEQNQRDFALKGGLPPTLERLYDDPSFKKEYPFGDAIRTSLASAAVRPRTPVYSDVSQAIFTTLHPPSSVTPDGVEGTARQGPEGASGGGPAVSETTTTPAADAAKEFRKGRDAGTSASGPGRSGGSVSCSCAPAAIVMLAVTAYPILYAVWLSLQRSDLRFPDESEFIGLGNYITVLSSSLWWSDLGRTCSSRSSPSRSSSCWACCSRS